MRRVLVIDPIGGVALENLDAGERLVLGEAPAGRVVRTAVWSASGRWAAWALDTDEPDGLGELRSRPEHAPEATVVASALSAFYLCPSPDGRSLSYLSPGPLGLELAVSALDGAGLRIVERGQPLYWSWAPDSTQLAVHVGERVFITALDGDEATPVCEPAGAFLAPWWMPDGSLVYAEAGRLVARGPDGAVTPLPVRAPGGRFALDADGRRLAAVELDAGEAHLVITDLLTGERAVAAREPTAGFFWSPDGRRLAALVLESPTRLQWLVADGADVVRLAPFRPNPAWVREVLPFFEQYSQSHSVWSPDGSELVAPALDADGFAVALVQPVAGHGAAPPIPGARFAWWAGAVQPGV
ncbi:MAG: hypothetical protein ACKVWR_05635 [Acidimicrobiales bacterium]